jgi:hypothetical protein
MIERMEISMKASSVRLWALLLAFAWLPCHMSVAEPQGLAGADGCIDLKDPCTSAFRYLGTPPPPDLDSETIDQLWSGINDVRINGASTELETVLRRLLVLEPVGSPAREWTLGELAQFSWIVDLSSYVDVFRACDEVADYRCSQVFVENALVFGARNWKVGLLRKALGSRGWEVDEENRDIIAFDGFRIELGKSVAGRYIHDLGLRELYADIRHIVDRSESEHDREKLRTWLQRIEASDEFWGTDSGNTHPVEVLAERISMMTPSEVYERVLDGDEGFIFAVSRFQKRLRVSVIWWPIERNHACRISAPEYDLLLNVLAPAYRQFLISPPVSTLENPCALLSALEELRWTFVGVCDPSIRIEEYAFEDPAEANRLYSSLLKRVLNSN